MDHIKPFALYFVRNLRENAKSYEFYSIPTFSADSGIKSTEKGNFIR